MSFLTFIEGIFGIKTAASQTATQTAAENLYNSLLEEEKQAATWVSGALAIINQNITIDAPLLSPIIKSVFPNVDPEQIATTLIALATKKAAQIQAAVPATLEDAITILQKYLIPKQGNDWIVAIQGLFSLAVTIASPVTVVQKAVAISEYVYQDIVTPLLGLHKSAPIVAPTLPVNASPATSITIPSPNPPAQVQV